MRSGSTHLRIIDLAVAEQRREGVVAGDEEAGGVDEELASDVEEDEEEVEGSETQYDVDLGDGRLLLEVVEGGVFRQLEHTSLSVQVAL